MAERLVRPGAIIKVLGGILGAALISFAAPVAMFWLGYWLKEGGMPNHWSWHNRGADIAFGLSALWFGILCGCIFAVTYYCVMRVHPAKAR